MDYCSPIRNKKSRKSCFNNNELKAIAKAYNKYTTICIGEDKCIKRTDLINLKSGDLYKDISEKLNKLCNNEYCWVDINFMKSIPDIAILESILYFTFKPKGTIDKNEWLSTYHINNILQQYQDMYKKDFIFLGAQPSDFSKIFKVDWKKLKKKKYIGIVFNIDPHDKPGKHWLSIFIDNKNKTVDYFDSLGHVPTKNISSFLKHFKTYKLNINYKAYQKGGSQCGIYAIHFLIERLRGETFKEIKNSGISDTKMKRYRDKFFRPVN